MASCGTSKKRKHLPAAIPEYGHHSPLWLLLMQKFALGKLSAKEVQELADAALKSEGAADLLPLQAFGGHGRSPQNIHRDLMTKYFSRLMAPQQEVVKAELQCKTSTGELKGQVMDVPLLLPHQWVQILDQHLGCIFPTLFNIVLFGCFPHCEPAFSWYTACLPGMTNWRM